MTFTLRDLLFWYNKMTREIVEDNIINDLTQKKKPMPSARTLKRMVDKKIESYKEVV